MNNAPRSNTTDGLEQRSNSAVSAPDGENKVVLRLNALDHEMVLEVRDAAGALVTTASRIVLALGDVDDAPEGYREAKFREFKWLETEDDCNPYHAWFLMTEPQPIEEE